MIFHKRELLFSSFFLLAFGSDAQTLTWGCGTYLGSGAIGGQSITGLGFQPDVVILKAFHNADGYIKTSAMAASESKSRSQG